MSLIISNSPDINFLSVRVTWDISNSVPKITLDNESTGPNLAGVSYAFVAASPTGTNIHDGDINSPDVTGIWTEFILADPWPRPFNQIEWSGAPYTFFVIAKDSNGNIYTCPTQLAFICRPNGNTKLSKNTYGLGTVYLQVDCAAANVYFQDTTNHTYKGLDGVIGSSVLRVVYPIDETYTIPAPFEINYFSTALVPITYSSDNYQYLSSSVYDYDFGDGVHIRIKYQSFNPKNGSPAVTFPVLCNIDLCPLVCEIDKLTTSIETGNCADVESAINKLLLINSKMNLIGIGIKEPLCGVDVPGLIEQVKAIGGFDCNCCNAATGIIPTTSSIIDGYNFQIVTVCGDISGTVNKTGNNIQFLLQDKKYVFKICEASPPTTTAFTVESTTTGDDCTKTYCLNIDGVQMAEDVLNNIKNNADLVNLFNSIVIVNPGNFDLIVDGGCIFNSSSTCDYSFFLSNIPSITTFALLSSIKIGSVNVALSYAFNMTNLAGLQTYLNGLGYGTFSVVASGSNGVLITSVANGNDIQQLTYKISGTTYLADLSKECTGYVPLSANEVVQNIINYLCALDDTQVKTSDAYTICYIDPDTGESATTIVASGVALTTFITELLARGCDTVTYILNKPPVTCDNMKTLFPSSVDLMAANDYFFGVKAGKCARITPSEAFLAMLNIGSLDASVVEAFCAFVSLCGGGLPCSPYTLFNLTVSDFDPTCPTIIGFDYTFTGSTLNITDIIFGNTPSGTQTVTIEYKLSSDSSYTVYSVSQSVGTDGTPSPAVSIALVAGSTYDIKISNNCDTASPPDSFENSVVVPGTPTDAVLTLSFTMSPFKFFTGSLNTPVAGDIIIERMFADGWDTTNCGLSADASAQRNGSSTISAGGTTVSNAPETSFGNWNITVRYTIYNVLINGNPHLNGDVINVGGDNVTIVIPSCSA